jgi:hypothetical protein
VDRAPVSGTGCAGSIPVGNANIRKVYINPLYKTKEALVRATAKSQLTRAFLQVLCCSSNGLQHKTSPLCQGTLPANHRKMATLPAPKAIASIRERYAAQIERYQISLGKNKVKLRGANLIEPEPVKWVYSIKSTSASAGKDLVLNTLVQSSIVSI